MRRPLSPSDVDEACFSDLVFHRENAFSFAPFFSFSAATSYGMCFIVETRLRHDRAFLNFSRVIRDECVEISG